jgi:hypothetical protein
MQVPPPLFEAIALKKCVNAIYNKTDMTLAPQILYTKHGEVHLDAIPVKKRGEPPRDLKLATFKLIGLSDIEIADGEIFLTDQVYDPADEKYDGVTVFAVEL